MGTVLIWWLLVSIRLLHLTFADHDVDVDVDIPKIISSMSLKQKINQMAQIDFSILFTDNQVDEQKIKKYFGEDGIGSLLVVPVLDNYFNASEYLSVMKSVQRVAKLYGHPPVIAGIDSVHGANYIKGSVLFPQQLNIASTFEPSYARYAGEIAARDTLAAGINWLFSPIIGLGIEPLWSRMYETFGEDPLVVGEFATEMVNGIQENGKSAACGKHFVGYSSPRNGHDRSPSWIPVHHLYQYFVRPWKRVIEKANLMTVMESYTEYDGVPNVANKNSLQTLLRQDLDFDGVLVTDYHEIENLIDFHKVAIDNNEAVGLTLSEGSVDMNMIPFNTQGWENGVMNLNEGKMQGHLEERINRSVRRILELKRDLKMFDTDLFEESSDLEKVGDPQVRETALQVARDSIVLAKNDNNVLPIRVIGGQDNSINVNVHVTGPTSNSIKYQSGGWTIFWQGANSDEDFTYGKTLVDAANDFNGWDVTSSCGVDIMGNMCDDSNESVANDQKANADYIIVCIGEESYTEKPGDIRDLSLAQGQRDFVATIKDSTDARIIVVYFGGRPRLLGDIVEHADAIILAFLPGPDGGQAITELISGDHNFSGKLPITYPKYPDNGNIPYWRSVSDQCTGPSNTNEPLPHYVYNNCEVEWTFGHGLSYTSFEYSGLRIDSDKVTYVLPWSRKESGSNANVSVNVKNTGILAGMETVMFFTFVENRHVTPEYKLLVRFERIHLQPNEERTIKFELSSKTFQHIGPHDDTHDVLQMGERLRVGVGPYTDCRIDGNKLCSDSITLEMGDRHDYNPSCESACINLHEHNCLVKHQLNTDQCYTKCIASPPHTYGGIGWGWSYVNCIESIFLDKRRSENSKCDDINLLCRNVFLPDNINNSSDTVPDTHSLQQTEQSNRSSVAVIVPTLAGTLGMTMIIFAFYERPHRGGKFQQEGKSVEFASISSKDVV